MNINRDYMIILNCEFTSPFIGDRFKLVKREKAMTFKRHDLNSSNAFIVVTGVSEPGLTLTMGLASPSGRVETLQPELIDIKDDVYIYEVKFKFEEVGTHKYQFFISDGKRKISSDIDKLKVEQCL